MAFLLSECNNLVVALDDKILIQNLGDNSSVSIKIPQSSTKAKENVYIVSVSQMCIYIAVVTDLKILLLYTKTNSSYECIQTHPLTRAVSTIRFSEDSSKIIIADKTGDVYVAEKINNWQPKLVLGHLSMLLDALITPDDKCIISCDRDEKIRVSAYPDTFNIIAYCLGHEEFVSSLDMLMEYPDVLFSASGDATIRAWHYHTGQQLLCAKLTRAIVCMRVILIEKHIFAIASLYDSCDVNICEISITTTNSMQCKMLQTISLPSQLIKFTVSERTLWFLGNNYLMQFDFDTANLCYVKKEDLVCSAEITELISQNTSLNESNFVASLFKKQYNNVEEYHKRKQMRMYKDHTNKTEC